MNILLHICCAPCAIFPADELIAGGHSVAGIFYNPNIHPYSEYLRRLAEVSKYAASQALSLLNADYDIERYFQAVMHKEDPSRRCPECWRLRIEKCAGTAGDNGFDAFTTTLLASPYQDHAALKGICEEAADKSGVSFYYRDFRIGFKDAHREARAKGIYCQNYCGCVFSRKAG